MNKINIINTDQEKIDGYYNINIEQAGKLINGTVEEMVCVVLDKYSYKDRISNLIMMCKKLGNLGLLTLKFVNATKICKDVIKGNMSSQHLSSVVLESNSLFLESDIIEIVSQIENIKIYKMYNDNTNTVIVLQKKL